MMCLKKMYIDMHFWLPQDILLKADKMTMANSIEHRVPFLDKVVWEVARRVPTKYLVKGMKTKFIFRDIADDKMPDEWSGRRKLGFPVPFSKWIREEEYYKENMQLLAKYCKEHVSREHLLGFIQTTWASVEKKYKEKPPVVWKDE